MIINEDLAARLTGDIPSFNLDTCIKRDEIGSKLQSNNSWRLEHISSGLKYTMKHVSPSVQEHSNSGVVAVELLRHENRSEQRSASCV
jgi:hypothetical protein